MVFTIQLVSNFYPDLYLHGTGLSGLQIAWSLAFNIRRRHVFALWYPGNADLLGGNLAVENFNNFLSREITRFLLNDGIDKKLFIYHSNSL